MIDVKRSFFEKVIKYRLRLFEASMSFIVIIFFIIQNFKIQLFVPIGCMTTRDFPATLCLSGIHDWFIIHDHN